MTGRMIGLRAPENELESKGSLGETSSSHRFGVCWGSPGWGPRELAGGLGFALEKAKADS